MLDVYRGGETLRARVLERSRRIRHRGPDWSGIHVKGKNIISHERLAIVGVDSGGQPLLNAAETNVLAVNGEIYNHLEIKAELKNPGTFVTKSDCEIILHLYEEHGEDAMIEAVNRLNGIFAFVLVDETTGHYFIARDHCGIIPLYWGRDEQGALWVASEMKALHDVCISFEDFPPGHIYSSKTGETSKWYTPTWHDSTYMPTKKVNLEELRTKLETTIQEQMMAEVPFGVLLSGGLDSSIISAVAARYVKKQQELDSEGTSGWWPKLHSFSIGLEGSPDLAAAREVASFIKTVHHEFNFTIDEGLNAIRDVIYHLETYDVTTVRAATPMYLMSRKIKALGVKMVLSGEGADEVFGGYLYFHKCPSKKDMQEELVRKVKGLYKFDCLRANKSTCAWGVEARVPFLDKNFLDYCMNDIDPDDKMCGRMKDGRAEKWILRKAFEGYLPDKLLWRQKEQFSDGVGYNWIDSIQAHAASQISDEEFAAAKYKFPHNTPPTKEAYFIRQTFESHYPELPAVHSVPGGPSVACSSAVAVLWDASFQKFADCSGRSVAGVHASAYDDGRRDQDDGTTVDTEKLKSVDISFCTTIKKSDSSLEEKISPRAYKKAKTTSS